MDVVVFWLFSAGACHRPCKWKHFLLKMKIFAAVKRFKGHEGLPTSKLFFKTLQALALFEL